MDAPLLVMSVFTNSIFGGRWLIAWAAGLIVGVGYVLVWAVRHRETESLVRDIRRNPVLLASAARWGLITVVGFSLVQAVPPWAGATRSASNLFALPPCHRVETLNCLNNPIKEYSRVDDRHGLILSLQGGRAEPVTFNGRCPLGTRAVQVVIFDGAIVEVAASTDELSFSADELSAASCRTVAHPSERAHDYRAIVLTNGATAGLLLALLFMVPRLAAEARARGSAARKP